MRRAFAVLAMTGTLVLGAGCAAPPARAPEDAVRFTREYLRQPGAQVLNGCVAPDWWRCYGSAELDALVAGALADNPGLAQVRARLDQAAATARAGMADLLPAASVSGDRAKRFEESNENESSLSLAGAAGYELDVWGKNRAAYKSGVLSARAGAQDVKAAEITLAASIVENWLRLLAAREEEDLLQEQVKTNQMVLDLQNKRYEGGIAGALDVLQQKEVLARANAQLPDTRADGELLTHQISLLAGRNPSAALALSGRELPPIAELPPAGVPAQLLQGRPDIIAAWLRLLSADWAAESARVARLPALDISAAYSTTGGKFSALFDTWLLNLALGLAMPVFDGGELAAQQARQKAFADERFHAYRETVLSAIGEVEDALTRNHHQARKEAAIRQQLAASRAALEQAQISYGNGNTSYISVLTSLTSVQSLEQQLVRARRDLALARVALYRAIGVRMGGGEQG